MHTVRTRSPRLVVQTAPRPRNPVVWARHIRLTSGEEDVVKYLYSPSAKYDLIKHYNAPLPPAHIKHPKLPIPIKPFNPKHTEEKEPWLFMNAPTLFTKSIHDLNKEAEEKRLNPSNEFHGVWLKDTDIERAKRERFAKELINFRNSYEKPIIDAFKEVDSQVEAEYTRQRFEKRKETRAARKRAQKKVQPGTTLARFMQEKEYWEKFVDALHIGDFASLPPKKEFMDLMEFESLKYDIGEPEYDTDLIKLDYGQKSDWSISQHLALMIPDDEVPELQVDKLFPPETMDQLYRAIKELEYIYGPIRHKIDTFIKYQDLAVQKHHEDYLQSKHKEIPPNVWEVFNPSHIKEFDDVKDPDSISLEEISYRFDRAYENWTKRLLDPEVENRVKNYVRNITGGGVWNRFTMGGNNKILQFADSSIADSRIFLKDEDVVRVLKGQLVDAGLARVVVKRKTPAQIEKEAKEKEEKDEFEKSLERQAGVTPAAVTTQSSKLTTTDTSITYTHDNVTYHAKKSPILTDDVHTYMEFQPVWKDMGTLTLPRKVKRIREQTKENLEDQFSQEVWKLDDRSSGHRRVSIKQKGKLKPAYDAAMNYERLTTEEMQDLMETQEEDLLAYRQYEKLRAIWPQPQVGSEDLEGKKLEEFMKSDRWFPVEHLFYNNNVEFFTRTLPLAPELTRADKMRMRKVVMRVFITPLELPSVVQRRLKLLLGPRYDDQRQIVTLTGSDRHTQKDNKAYLKLLFREILHEAWLADPNYIPTREPAIEPPLTWKPSEAAANVEKPVLFRLYGIPLQDQSKPQGHLTTLENSLNNPDGLIPNPSVSREASFLKIKPAPPKQIQDPKVVAKNRKKQLREKALREAREPKYTYNPAGYYSFPKEGEEAQQGLSVDVTNQIKVLQKENQQQMTTLKPGQPTTSGSPRQNQQKVKPK